MCHFLRMCSKCMFGLKQCGIHAVCRTAQSALHLTPWDTCSFRHTFGFSWKHSAMLQLLCEDVTRQSPVFYHIMFTVSWYVVCRLYSVGALLHNCMTTAIICFNLRYVIFRGALEQQCIRYLTSNVFGSGPIATLKIYY